MKLYKHVKKMVDRGIAAISILAITPVLVGISIIIAIDDPGPVIFKQERAGRWHRPFTIYKFRTMRQNAPNLSTEEMRQRDIVPYTRVGPFLRRTSLDELPQLFNVLRGEMSLVGPRPALMTQQVVLDGRAEAGVDQLLPGITGLAQITGRDDLKDEEKIRRDSLYLEHLSLLTDTILVFYTLRSVFKSKGVY